MRFQIFLSQDEEEFLIKKFNLDPDSKLSLGQQLKGILLSEGKIEDEDNRYKKLRNEKLDIDIKIKKKEYEFMTIFETKPSPQAEKAIKKGTEYRELTEKEFENVTKYLTIRRDSLNPKKWIGKCDICKDGESYDGYKELLDDMVIHLTTEHAKKVMVMSR